MAFWFECRQPGSYYLANRPAGSSWCLIHTPISPAIFLPHSCSLLVTPCLLGPLLPAVVNPSTIPKATHPPHSKPNNLAIKRLTHTRNLKSFILNSLSRVVVSAFFLALVSVVVTGSIVPKHLVVVLLSGYGFKQGARND